MSQAPRFKANFRKNLSTSVSADVDLFLRFSAVFLTKASKTAIFTLSIVPSGSIDIPWRFRMPRFTRSAIARSGGDPILRLAYEARQTTPQDARVTDKGTSGTVRESTAAK